MWALLYCREAATAIGYMEREGIEFYYHHVKRWSYIHRIRKYRDVLVPAFKHYVFVHESGVNVYRRAEWRRGRFFVLGGQIMMIEDSVIEQLRNRDHVEFEAGQAVLITSGPLANKRGTVISMGNECLLMVRGKRVRVQVDRLMRVG